MDCAITYPGCTQCLNGVCAACNETLGYELSYSKCICQPGYYFKQLECLPYNKGKSLQRLFMGYPFITQDLNTSLIVIMIYFRCEGLKIPYGIRNSVTITVNGEEILLYGEARVNTTLAFSFFPTQAIAQANIKVEFKNRTLYDLD